MAFVDEKKASTNGNTKDRHHFNNKNRANVKSVIQILSCPVCLEMYETSSMAPKILPSCGHSICVPCVQKVTTKNGNNNKKPSKITCPECRTDSQLASEGIEGLKTNIQLQRTVEYFEAVNDDYSSMYNSPLNEPCPHVGFVKNWKLCLHCYEKFCDICLFRHNERVKMEVGWIGSGLKDRLKKATDNLEGTIEAVKLKIDEEVRRVQQEVAASCDAIEAAAKEAVDTYRRRSFERAKQIGEEQLASVMKVIEAAKQFPEKSSITDVSISPDEITKVASSSLMFFSLTGQLGRMHQKIVKKDRELAALEKLSASPNARPIKLDQDERFVELLTQLNEIKQATLTWVDDFSSSEVLESAAGNKKYDEHDYPDKKGHQISEQLKEPFTEEERLHRACQRGDLAAVKEIFHRASLPYFCEKFVVEHTNYEHDVSNFTPLMDAAANGHLEVVKFLVEEKGADIFAMDMVRDIYAMPIHVAAEKGHLEVVKFFLEHESSLATVEDGSDDTVICRAAFIGHLDMVKLVDGYLNDDERICWDRTALAYAACGGHFEVVKFLFEKRRRSFDGESIDKALIWAIERERPEVIYYLVPLRLAEMSKDERQSAEFLHEAARSCSDVAIFDYLFEKLNVCINCRNSDGETPLHVAARAGRLEMAKHLVTQKGASVTARSHKSQRMAIHFACSDEFHSNVELVAFLLDACPESVNSKDSQHLTPLDVAKAAKQMEIVKFLETKITHRKGSASSSSSSGFVPAKLEKQQHSVKEHHEVSIIQSA